jgi:hypothetical protein
MVRFEELIREGGRWKIKSLYLNPSYIITIEEDEYITRDLRCEQVNSKFPEGLDRRHSIAKITYTCGSSTSSARVIGRAEAINEKILGYQKTIKGPLNILKG